MAASQLRRGKLLIPDGKWEFTARGEKLFARYVGPESVTYSESS